ncbi:hypothetical protein EDC96DRAFT_550646 [Choanephora cucurbitarum]|nr:hypothetical protein EDC96DRAFT_550646 [Choanephora cucurbitarum]
MLRTKLSTKTSQPLLGPPKQKQRPKSSQQSCRALNTRHNSQALDTEEASDDEDDIFSQFIQNNQEINKQKNSKTASRIRFTVSAEKVQQEKPLKIMVDAGFTTCTYYDRKKLAFQPNIIQYENGTTQLNKERAILNLKFNNNWTSRIYAFDIQQQIEHIILDMDWMTNEDIYLHPKTQSVFKKKQSTNTQDSIFWITDLIKTYYPKPIETTEHQTVTNERELILLHVHVVLIYYFYLGFNQSLGYNFICMSSFSTGMTGHLYKKMSIARFHPPP